MAGAGSRNDKTAPECRRLVVGMLGKLGEDGHCAVDGCACLSRGDRPAARGGFQVVGDIRNATLVVGGRSKTKTAQPETKGLGGQNATIPVLCCQLEDLTERLCRGSRGIGVTGIYICQRTVKRPVAQMLANEERIRALLDHQHGRRMFQDVWVL